MWEVSWTAIMFVRTLINSFTASSLINNILTNKPSKSIRLQLSNPQNINLFPFPSILPSIHPSFHPSILSSIHSSIHSFIHPFIHSSIHLFIIHSFIHPSIHPSIHSSIHSFIHSFIHPSIHPSIYYSFIHPSILSHSHPPSLSSYVSTLIIQLFTHLSGLERPLLKRISRQNHQSDKMEIFHHASWTVRFRFSSKIRDHHSSY